MVRQIEGLRERVQEAESEASSLREELASQQEARHSETPDRDDNSEVVRRLSRRIDELTKDLQRVERRTQRSVEDARRQERTRLLAGLGDVLDSTERALEMQGAEGPWRQGIEAIHTQLIRYLEAEGAELFGEVGEKMDPHRHEAVGVVDVEKYDKGEIVNIERRGIELEDGTVVRTARVQVAG
ncbi:MAG: nucleotide exchange factor GrpE [Myxococcota bacterium]